MEMNQLDLLENQLPWLNLIDHYKKLRTKEDGKRPLADANYYLMFGRWLSAEEDCIYLINKHCLYFRDHRKITLFLLKWS
jgi:hypothetical protein